MSGAEKREISAFAAELRAQRAAREWTQVELGRRIGYSGSFISDVERGDRAPGEDFAQRCDVAFGLPGTFARLHEDLRRNAYPPFFAPVLPYEREADKISGWCFAVPGLLQTERYARSVIRAGRPRDDEESVQRTIEARMERQQVLAKPKPPMLWCVVPEGALRHVVGDRDIMGEQVDKLIKAAEAPGIVIQALPYTANDHPGIEGPFWIFEHPGGTAVGYSECYGGGRLIERQDEVGDLTVVMGMLRAAALAPRESLDLMRAIRRDLDG
ncbi:MAG TPA: helix-turn-helix transcriptional regulator [Trebonia sp.]|nr:helix-turn-helix transcriptional regulator [Trebonia sp.]